MSRSEHYLQLLLRIVGAMALLAIFAVFLPHSWMNAIHRWAGLGELPDDPIVGYLARSTSAFYAALGGLYWVISFDVRRHRAVLNYLGAMLLVFGVVLLATDVIEGMPLWWIICEGPFALVCGTLMLTWNRPPGDAS